MATISFRISAEEKEIISKYSKEQNLTMSEFILTSIFSNIQDKEDYLLGEKRMLDTENKITGNLKKLAKDCEIDYDAL